MSEPDRRDPGAAREAPLSIGELAKRGAIGATGAALGNAFLAWIAGAALPIPEAFVPLGIPRVVFLTVVGAALATVTYAIVDRVSSDPEPAFVKVAVIALVLSFIPDILLLVNPSAVPGTTTLGVLVLMVMHVVAAAIIVPALIGSRWVRRSG